MVNDRLQNYSDGSPRQRARSHRDAAATTRRNHRATGPGHCRSAGGDPRRAHRLDARDGVDRRRHLGRQRHPHVSRRAGRALEPLPPGRPGHAGRLPARPGAGLALVRLAARADCRRRAQRRPPRPGRPAGPRAPEPGHAERRRPAPAGGQPRRDRVPRFHLEAALHRLRRRRRGPALTAAAAAAAVRGLRRAAAPGRGLVRRGHRPGSDAPVRCCGRRL
jgi:hypothetical protein